MSAVLPAVGQDALDASVKEEATPERIAQLALELSARVQSAVVRIENLNNQSRLLSLNAQIESARCGHAGAAFGVVASEMRKLSESTADVARSVTEETGGTIADLSRISEVLATNVRGTRLADLALNNIDLIDRNLYERSCDCRWWATDSSLVDALTLRTPEARSHASSRMGVILNAYTVYFDLVLADLTGEIVANGRPDRFPSQGTNHCTADWFRTALQTQSGEEFGFHSAHPSSLVGGERVLIYSAGVRERGETHGNMLGALGIVFNWDALAQTIVNKTPLSPAEMKRSRVCIADSSGRVLADSQNQQLRDVLDFPGREQVMRKGKGFEIVMIDRRPHCVAHSPSPGFETYATGWHSFILQEMT